ncbi:MAG: PAS domain S-box protein [Hyphomicrobiales bacterium]|nr:PAS domain S-box protein [Hyphomicrobiales bacterium]
MPAFYAAGRAEGTAAPVTRAGAATSDLSKASAGAEIESEVRLRAILDNAVDGIITINDQGTIESINPAAQRLFGYRADELVGANVELLMPDPYRTEHDRYLRNYRQTGQKKIIGIGREVVGRRKDGSVFPLDLAVSEFTIGERRLFTGIVRDVTERKRVDDERKKFVALVENSSDFIATASLNWQLLSINKAGQALIGVRSEDVAEMELRDLWHEDTLPTVLQEALPAQTRGESFRFEGRLKHAVTGEPIDVDCNAFGILDPHNGSLLATAFSLRDIRENKRAEQALRDNEARLKAILDSAVDGIVTINERGTIESVNPAALSIFGYGSDELIGQNVKMLMPEPYRREHDQYLRNYRHTGQRKIIGIGREVVGRRKDGTEFPLDLSVSEVPVGEGRLFTGLIRDITGRKRSENHQKLLMAELSHRVKNTLATVISIGQMSFRGAASYEEARESFEGRILALAQTHSRLAETNWSGAMLRDVIEDEMLPYRAEDRTNVSVAGPDIHLTPKGAIALGMAFHELATNAAKYGALSDPNGMVRVSWDMAGAGRQLVISWTESGGPEVKPPERVGFGRVLLERGLAVDLQGKVQLDFCPSGLRCVIAVPIESARLNEKQEP